MSNVNGCKCSDNRPILAICYDFDKTLSPDDMQAQGFIQSVGYETLKFWNESNDLATKNDMDQNLAYMYMMFEKSRGKVLFTRNELKNDGAKVELFPGVRTWFARINQYGKDKGVVIEHYIISSGLKEMIEGTAIAGEFKKIYASSFYYDESGVAVWPAQAVNYTNKTQFLFRIENDDLKRCISFFSRIMPYINEGYGYNSTYLEQFIGDIIEIKQILKVKNELYKKVYIELFGKSEFVEVEIDHSFWGGSGQVDFGYCLLDKKSILSKKLNIKVKLQMEENDYIFCKTYEEYLEKDIWNLISSDVEDYMVEKRGAGK